MAPAPHRRAVVCWLLAYVLYIGCASAIREVQVAGKTAAGRKQRDFGPRKLTQAPAGTPQDQEAELMAGDPLPCQFLVFFNPESNSSVDADITSMVKHLQSQEARAASVADKETAVPPINITTVFGRTGKPAGDDWLLSLNGTTRPESQNCTEDDDSCKDFPQSRFIKAILLSACAEDPDGAKLLQGIAGAPSVSAVVANRVVSSQQAGGDDSSSLLASPAVGRVSPTTLPGTSWPGCMNPGMALAWWGRRCAQDPQLTEWVGVYAFYSATGKVVEGCVKRRENLTTAEADAWLGQCGVPPRVTPNPLQAAACVDLKNTDDAVYSQQATFVHPKRSCGKGKPIKMTFSGNVCRFDPGIGASLLQWTLARPVPGQPNVAKSGCDIRLAGKGAATAADAKKFLGGCGSAPSVARRLKICAAARAPPPSTPPSPPPSPPPKIVKEFVGLDMEYRILGEADPTMLKRIRAVTADDRVPAESNWKRGKPAAVAVIDSGIYCAHPDLNVVYNASVFPFRDGCYDPYGHGTHVAGLIGARNNGQGVVGAAPGVPILIFRALGTQGKGSVADITSQINAILDYRPPRDHPEYAPVVVNFSLAYPYTFIDRYGNLTLGPGGTMAAAIAAEMRALCLPYQKLQDAGIMPVAAAGNSGREFIATADKAQRSLPAACDGVLAVTAVRVGSDGPNRLVDASAVFDVTPEASMSRASSYALSTAGEAVLNRTVAAPGFACLSTMAPGSGVLLNDPATPGSCQPGPASADYMFCSLSGTSMSAATMSGLVARCYASGACSKNMTQAARLAAITGPSQQYNMENFNYGFRNDPASLSDGDAKPYYGWLVDGGAYISTST